MKTPIYPKTPAQARAWFTTHGISITDFCNEKQLDRYIVTELLRGRIKGIRGESHRAAIVLGIKPDPDLLQHAA